MSTLPPFYHNDDPHSFGFETTHSRWPTIVRKAVADTQYEYSLPGTTDLKVKQGKEIVELLEQLQSDIKNDAPIEPFNSSIPGLNSYDETLKSFGKLSWLSAPWLYSECFFYRIIDRHFKERSEWTEFDVFEKQKRTAFAASSEGVYELSERYRALQKTLAEKQKAGTVSLKGLRLLFEELVDISLWGNASDLSLLANATMEDLQSQQGSEAIAKASKNILCNDLPQAWDQLLSVPEAERRVDFVLDNAGFEFFSDVVFALFLLDSKLASKVVFHCKTRPWMVSDTMIKDYDLFLQDMRAFPDHKEDLSFLVDRLEQYKAAGKFGLLDSEFWCIDLVYWHLEPDETKYGGAELWKYFQDSSLVIIKGDLNYRKLTADRQWPRDTPFLTAIERLANSGIHILALRTCKADVCAGLPEGKDEELCKYWKEQGHKYGELWASSGKWAVISYSSGKK